MKIKYIAVLSVFLFSRFAYSQNIKLLSPNGGENWEANIEHEITWKSEEVSNLRIEYSTDNGISWNAISLSFPAFTGKYSWFAPSINSSEVIIRIYDVSNYSIGDTSNSTFSIGSLAFLSSNANSSTKTINQGNQKVTAGTLSLTSPNPSSDGDIVWIAGTTNPTITWTSGGISTVDIYYSINGGDNFTFIQNVSASSGTFSWSVPSSVPATTEFVIEVVDHNNSSTTSQNAHYVFVQHLQSFSLPAKILPLGNSITFGIDKTPGLHTGDLGGYRAKLWDLLRNDNYNFDFIGSEYSGYDVIPDYQNGGFPGITTGDCLSILQSGINTKWDPDEQVAPGAYLNYYQPNVILLHIGTNDADPNYSTAVSNVESIIDYIGTNYPSTWLILAKILDDNSGGNTNFETFNNQIEDYARLAIASQGYKILIVDMYNIPGFIYSSGSGGDLSDAVHPNASGYAKMAQVWYNALKLILPSGSTSVPSFAQSNVDTTANIGVPFNYQASASGLGAPVYSLSGNPSGMTINQYTGKISWTPTTTGNYPSVVITATTPSSATATQTLNINVYAAPNEPANLVSYWKFNQNSSGPFLDSYNANNGYTASSITSVSGRIERALSFDGSTDKISIMDEPAFDISSSSSSFSVEAWVKISGNITGVIAGKYGSRYNNVAKTEDGDWALGLNSGVPYFFVHYSTGNTSDEVDASGAISTGVWHHIVGVKDASSSQIRIYIDGQSPTTHSASNSDFNSMYPLEIGSLRNTKYFSGSIDEVAFFNGALSNTDVTNIYNTGIGTVAVNVKAFLQGPYNSGAMSTLLNSGGYLQTYASSQPYNNSPWNYGGLESVGAGFFSSHTSIVDWILLEIRKGTASSTIVTKRAAFIESDGSVVDQNGSSLNVYGILPGKYYITVKHRNHLAMMSLNPVSLPNSSAYDFTVSGSAYGTNPEATLNDGKLGMWGGDANADGLITGTDFNVFNPKFTNAATGYEASDWNLDGQVTGTDFNLFNPNFTNARSTQVP